MKFFLHLDRNHNTSNIWHLRQLPACNKPSNTRLGPNEMRWLRCLYTYLATCALCRAHFARTHTAVHSLLGGRGEDLKIKLVSPVADTHFKGRICIAARCHSINNPRRSLMTWGSTMRVVVFTTTALYSGVGLVISLHGWHPCWILDDLENLWGPCGLVDRWTIHRFPGEVTG